MGTRLRQAAEPLNSRKCSAKTPKNALDAQLSISNFQFVQIQEVVVPEGAIDCQVFWVPVVRSVRDPINGSNERAVIGATEACCIITGQGDVCI